MVITKIRLNRHIALAGNRTDRLLALVSVQFDNMVTIYGIRVVLRPDSSLKIKMPSRQNRRNEEAECLVLNSIGLSAHLERAIREALEDEGCPTTKRKAA